MRMNKLKEEGEDFLSSLKSGLGTPRFERGSTAISRRQSTIIGLAASALQRSCRDVPSGHERSEGGTVWSLQRKGSFTAGGGQDARLPHVPYRFLL